MPKAPARILPTLETVVVSIVTRDRSEGAVPCRHAAFTSLQDARDYVVAMVPVENDSPFHAYTIQGMDLRGNIVTIEQGDNAALVSCRR